MGTTEAQARETATKLKLFGLCTILGSIGAAVFGLKWIFFCLLPPGVAIVRYGEDRQLAGLLGVVLGSVGALVLGLPCWVVSWILPIVGFVSMKTWEPVSLGESIVLLGVERVVLIVGVPVLGLQWMLASPVATVVIVQADSLAKGVKLVVAVGIVGMAVLGLKWGLAVLGLKWGLPVLAIAELPAIVVAAVVIVVAVVVIVVVVAIIVVVVVIVTAVIAVAPAVVATAVVAAAVVAVVLLVLIFDQNQVFYTEL